MTMSQDKFSAEMRELLLKNLASEVEIINSLYAAQAYSELLKLVHKLHGAVCYCDIPQLKNAIHNLETALKQNNLLLIPELFQNMSLEVNKLLKV